LKHKGSQSTSQRNTKDIQLLSDLTEAHSISYFPGLYLIALIHPV